MQTNEKPPFTLKSLIQLCCGQIPRSNDPLQFYTFVNFQRMAVAAAGYLADRRREEQKIGSVRDFLSKHLTAVMFQTAPDLLPEAAFKATETTNEYFITQSQHATKKITVNVSLETYLKDFLENFCINGMGIYPVSVIYAPQIEPDFLIVVCFLKVESSVAIVFGMRVIQQTEADLEAFKEIKTVFSTTTHIPADFWVNVNTNASYNKFKNIRGYVESYKFAPKDLFPETCYMQNESTSALSPDTGITLQTPLIDTQ